MSTQSFYELLAKTTYRLPEKMAFFYRNQSGQITGYTYCEIKEMVDSLIAGLISLDLDIGDRILLLCDASVHWIITDCAIISSGFVSVPRGTDVTDDDINYITSHSESKIAIVQKPKDLQRLQNLAPETIQKIYVMENESGALNTEKDGLKHLMERGQKLLIQNPEIISERLKRFGADDLATLIYTSGTTGAPKGVMLNQTGWLQTIESVAQRVDIKPDDKMVSLLPPWHAFERGLEYAVIRYGIQIMISDPNTLRDDLKEFKPTIFPSVPRIWEKVYNGIINRVANEKPLKQMIFRLALTVGKIWAKNKAKLFNYDFQIQQPNWFISMIKKNSALFVLMIILPFKALAMLVFASIKNALGGSMRLSVSGGSALPGVVDEFLSAIGITVMEGYGMTETSAVISIRPFKKPAAKTVGTPLLGYEVKIVDENNQVVKKLGQKGTLWVKSKQILMGYYKRPELNEIVFDNDGFFNTGDLIAMNWRGELMFSGRAKDTIALSSGENIEPVPIEDKLLGSIFIDQVMVIGDDKKNLAALIVPNYTAIKSQIKELTDDYSSWNAHPEIRKLIRKEISNMINHENGFKSFEFIPGNQFYILPRPFDLDTEMTRTLKMKRDIIKSNYDHQIQSLYKN